MTTIKGYVSTMNVKELKGLCKKHKIKRYSRLVKNQLVDIIYDKYIELYDIQKLKKYNTIYENINFAFNDIIPNINTKLTQDKKIDYYRDTYDIEGAKKYLENGDTNGRHRCAISMNHNLTYDIIVKSKDIFEDWFGSYSCWHNISKYYSYLSIDFIEEFKDSINWRQLIMNHNLTDEIILKYQDKIKWTKLSKNPCLSLELIEKYINNVDNMRTKNKEIEDKYTKNITIYLKVLNNILKNNANLNIEFIYKYFDEIDNHEDIVLKNLLKNPYAPDNIKQLVCEVENSDFIKNLIWGLDDCNREINIGVYIRNVIDINDIDYYNENDVLTCDNVDKYKDVLNWYEIIRDWNIPYKIYSYIINNYIHKLPIDFILDNKRFKVWYYNTDYHSSYAYKRKQQRNQMEIIEEELIANAWHPNRVFRWCFTECEKIDIENNFK